MSDIHQPSDPSVRDRRGKVKPARHFVPQDLASAPASQLDPVLHRRRRPFSYPGPVIMAICGGIFVAYIFNFAGTQNFFDNFFNNLYKSTQAHADQVGTAYNAALPFVLLGLLALIVGVIVSSRRQAEAIKRRTRPLTWREAVTLHGFVSSATKHEVAIDVAREAFRLLLPFCRYGLRTRMSDTLRGDLRMTQTEVVDIYADLILKTERKHDPKSGEPRIETVLDLLQTASKCPKRYLVETESAEPMERRGEENWVVRPAGH